MVYLGGVLQVEISKPKFQSKFWRKVDDEIRVSPM